MYFFYAILTNLALLLSPFIFIYRILKGKEDPKRFKEKICIYSQKRTKNKVWIHAASIGELMSVIPIIKKLEKNNEIFFKYSPTKKFKKVVSKKISNENPFKILKNLNLR